MFRGCSAGLLLEAVDEPAQQAHPDLVLADGVLDAVLEVVGHLALATVDGLIAKYTDGRGLGFSGEQGVNVLELNLALDRLTGAK